MRWFLAVTLCVLVTQGAAAQTSESGASSNIDASVGSINQNFGGSNQSKTETDLNRTPDVYAPMAPSTAPCRVGGSAGIGMTGIGITAGTSIKDEECDMRETAIVLHNLGVQAVATVYLCMNDPEIKAAFDQAGINCDLSPPPEVLAKQKEYEEEKARQHRQQLEQNEAEKLSKLLAKFEEIDNGQ